MNQKDNHSTDNKKTTKTQLKRSQKRSWKAVEKRRSKSGDRPDFVLPVILHKRRSVGASPVYWLIIPRVAAWGTGMVSVIGLWNLRRRGSIVQMGDTATLLPNILVTRSDGIGWAYWGEKAKEESFSKLRMINEPVHWSICSGTGRGHPLRDTPFSSTQRLIHQINVFRRECQEWPVFS
jgi:hypothetical protein